MWTMTFAFLLVSISAREWLVFRLRSSNRALWEQLGAPAFFERDHLLLKFPYRGWISAYRASGLIDRCALVIFALTSIGFILGVIAGVWRYWA